MARKSAEVEEVVTSKFAPDYSEMFDVIEKDFGLSSQMLDPKAKASSVISTGMLMNDFIMGGGIFPGMWATVYGPEQSCKSTTTMHILKSCVANEVPIVAMYDFEGSFDAAYCSNMYNNSNIEVDSVFGLQDESTGKWVIQPSARYYSVAVAEKFFDSLASLLRKLPNKEFINGQWFFVYENTKENRKVVGDNYSKKLFTRYNAFYVPAENVKPQAVIIVDSYPAMLPEKQDVEDPNNAIAVQARMFSDNLKKITGKLRGKAVTVIGVNQLRAVPMAMYGPTESEPCGVALRFFSDLRNEQRARSASAAGFVAEKGEGGMVFYEDSVTGEGKDKYRIIAIKNTKNKMSNPYMKGFARLWISDCDGVARGFDPAYDTLEFLKITGQATGTFKKLNIKIGNLEIKGIDWLSFKKLILLRGTELKNHCKSLGLTKNPKLRERGFEQLRTAEAFKLYAAHAKSDE